MKIKNLLVKFFSLRLKLIFIYLIFAVSFIFLLTGFVLFNRSIEKQKDDFEWIIHTYDVIQSLNQLKITLLKSEKLILSKKNPSAELNKIYPQILKISSLVLDNSLQSKEINDLNDSLRNYVHENEKISIDLIQDSKEKIIFMIEEEKNLLKKRKEVSDKDLQKIKSISLIFISISILFLTILFLFIIVQLNLKIKSEQEVIKLNLALEEQVQFQSQLLKSDQMTGAINKSYLVILLEKQISNLKNHSEPFSFAYIDLDNFKWVNDHLGHRMGDRILIEVTKIAKNYLHAFGYFARLGGDEFAILIPNQNEKLAKMLIREFQNECNLFFKKENVPVSLSIGLVTFYSIPESIEKLIQLSDALMYKVKKKSKNGIQSRIFLRK